MCSPSFWILTHCIHCFLPNLSYPVWSSHFFEGIHLQQYLCSAHTSAPGPRMYGSSRCSWPAQHFLPHAMCLAENQLLKARNFLCQRGGISVANEAFPSKTSNDWKQRSREQICYPLGSCTYVYEPFGGAAVVSAMGKPAAGLSLLLSSSKSKEG